MRNCNEDAVSEVLSLIITFMIATGAIATILVWGVPYMDGQKAFVAVESVLLQFDAIGELLDDAFSEGTFDAEYGGSSIELANSSKTMNFNLDAGDLYIDSQGERFVFYYSVYDHISMKTNRFDFDIYDLDPGDSSYYPYSFTFEVTGPLPKDPVTLVSYFTQLNTGETYTGADEIFNGGDVGVGRPIPCNFPLTDAIRIDIKDDKKPPTEYGRIFIFDVGSLIYEISSSSNSYKAIVENGGVFSTSSGVSRYFFSEPKYFPQKLLDNNDMLTFKITQIKNNPNEGAASIGGTDSSLRVKFWLKPYNSSTEESKTQIFSPFNMLIYGDDGAVSAWRFFYKYRSNFQYDSMDNNKLYWFPRDEENVLFSFNRAVCYLKMEVEN